MAWTSTFSLTIGTPFPGPAASGRLAVFDGRMDRTSRPVLPSRADARVTDPRGAGPGIGAPRAEASRVVRPNRRRLLALAGAVPAAGAAGAALSGCGVVGGLIGGEPGGREDLRSEVTPLEPGPVTTAHGALTPFTAAFVPAALAEAGTANLVCSPASALIALTMTGLGAAGETRAQMEEVLGGSMEELAEVSAVLRTTLEAIPTDPGEGRDEADPDAAALVNAVWIADGMEVQGAFLDDLSRYFDAGVRTADFAGESTREKARGEMNGLVEDVTEGKIQELVPQDALRPNTVIVLVNALHLQGAWPRALDDAGELPFRAEDGEVTVPMLRGEADGWYEDARAQATLLRTDGGDLGLVLVRPVEGLAALLEAWRSDPSQLTALLETVTSTGDTVELTMPGLDLSSDLSLAELLQEMGMVDAFTGAADFSGISPSTGIMLTHVLQKATIVVDEEGMEAAAATAVIGAEGAAPSEPRPLVLDVPYVALAISTAALAPLVVAVVGDPTVQDG